MSQASQRCHRGAGTRRVGGVLVFGEGGLQQEVSLPLNSTMGGRAGQRPEGRANRPLCPAERKTERRRKNGQCARARANRACSDFSVLRRERERETKGVVLEGLGFIMFYCSEHHRRLRGFAFANLIAWNRVLQSCLFFHKMGMELTLRRPVRKAPSWIISCRWHAQSFELRARYRSAPGMI